jgi:hypothetical protein
MPDHGAANHSHGAGTKLTPEAAAILERGITPTAARSV